MKNTSFLTLGLSILIGAASAQAQISMAPLTTFGNNGWLAPNGVNGSTYTFLDTANNERGLAYGDGELFLVSRVGGNNIRTLNPITGADMGGLSTTGITGGTFAVNDVAVGGDGTVYVANLTTQSTTSPFKVYSWTSGGLASAPTVAYSGNGGLAGARLGDDFAATGSGASTLLAAGYNSTPSVPGNNGYAIINPTASLATAIGFTGTPPNAGDFRLGLTFASSSQVLGTAGSSLYRVSTFSGSSGTLVASPAIPDPSGATADRLLSYDVVNGQALLAVQSIGDSHVSIYNVTDPTAPVYLASGDTTVGTLTANANGTGEVTWGTPTINGDGSWSVDLYAMSSNQGIQAFVVSEAVPEPSVIALSVIGLGGLLAVRRFRAVVA
jgi:hypothetical protein